MSEVATGGARARGTEASSTARRAPPAVVVGGIDIDYQYRQRMA